MQGIETHYKPTETFQYTHYTSSHAPGAKRGFNKGEAIRLLRTNSFGKNFQKSLINFKTRLLARGYPKTVERIISEVSFAGRQSALKQKKKTHEQILPFVTTYHPGVKNLKNILVHKWSLIQNQSLPRTIFKKPQCYNIRQERQIAIKRHARESKALKAQ